LVQDLDVGVIGRDGYLRLVGRIKDMIRVGGKNVAAADVESEWRIIV
jgi:fatty-acyl-CoA synthase